MGRCFSLRVFFSIFYWFIFWGCAGCSLPLQFSLVVASRGSSLVSECGLLSAGASCCRARALGSMDFRSCGPGSRAQAQQLWYTSWVAPQHVASSQTRDLIHDSCIDRWILIRWTTREAQESLSNGYSLGRWESSEGGWWWRLHNTMNVLNATELYT